MTTTGLEARIAAGGAAAVKNRSRGPRRLSAQRRSAPSSSERGLRTLVSPALHLDVFLGILERTGRFGSISAGAVGSIRPVGSIGAGPVGSISGGNLGSLMGIN